MYLMEKIQDNKLLELLYQLLLLNLEREEKELSNEESK